MDSIDRRTFLQMTGLASGILLANLGIKPALASEGGIKNYVGFLRFEVASEEGDGVQTPVDPKEGDMSYGVPQLTDSQLKKAIQVVFPGDNTVEYASLNDSRYIGLSPEQFIDFLGRISPEERREILTFPGGRYARASDDLVERIMSGQLSDGKVRGNPESLKSNFEHLPGYNGDPIGAFLSVYARDNKESSVIYPVQANVEMPDGDSGTKVNTVTLGPVSRREINLAYELVGEQHRQEGDGHLLLDYEGTRQFLTGVAAETAFGILDYESRHKHPDRGSFNNPKGRNFAVSTAVNRHLDRVVGWEPRGSRFWFPRDRPQYVANVEFLRTDFNSGNGSYTLAIKLPKGT